jgi:hypothetical protein
MKPSSHSQTGSEFEKLSRTKSAPHLVLEFFSFLSHTKKWWLMPVVILLLLLALLIALGGSGAAPFIYTIF